MRVLMTTDAVGGVFTYSVQLAQLLRPAGVQVSMVSMGRSLSEQQRAQVRQAGASVVETEYQLEWMDDPWQDVASAGRLLLELERQLDPDVIHVNGYAHAALPWQTPVLLVAHSCVCSWWRAVLGERAPDRYDRYREEVTRGLAAAHVTVAPTASMLACLGEHYGPVQRGRVIANGIVLPSEPEPNKGAFILSAGRVWDRAKNIQALDAAAASLTWPVFVAGDRMDPDGHEAFPLSSVCPLGPLPAAQLSEWMRCAAIYASPARYEPFGLSILEAAAAGCALVLGDIPSLRELWEGAALFVDPADPDALSHALMSLIREPAWRVTLGKNARQRAGRYGGEPMAQSYLALYRSLSASRRAVPEVRGAQQRSSA
jgi:glycogen synthase